MSPHALRIGTHGWVKTLKEITDPLGPDFWSGFKPASESELRKAEAELGRKLDPEFREFYRKVGYGDFPSFGGQFLAPDELILGAGPAIYFITGSLTPGAEWASPEQHKRLWLSRGAENPDPRRFTEEVLTLDGVKLYDLVQFGSNGCCCYHQLYIGPEPAPLRYCLLTDSQEMEDRAASFSEGLEKILAFHLLDVSSETEAAADQDAEFGFYKNDCGLWSLNGTVDFPFQNNVPVCFELTEQRRHLPESMEKNVKWVMSNLGEIWNESASVVNSAIEAQQIQTPKEFSLNRLWAHIPDRALETSEWKLRIEPRDMPIVFELVFKGLKAVSQSCTAT